MERKLQLLKICIIVYTLTILSCNSQDNIDTKNIFETSVKSDSLLYYFPKILNDSVERRNPNFRDFKQKWYSSSLYSFKEPILYTKTDSQIIYRLLWLRSFHKPICISIKETKNGYFINSKTLDRQPAFYPILEGIGRDSITRVPIIDTIQKADRFAIIDFNLVSKIKSEEWNKIQNYLEKLNFWNSPIPDPNDEQTTDGSNWIIEGRKNGSYHFIDRRNAIGDLKELGKYLLKISSLKIKDDEIY
jgi:hypothetical protein